MQLIFGILSFLFFSAGSTFAQDAGLKISDLTNSSGGVATTSPTTLINNVVNTVLIVAGAITFAYLIFGAIKWITSGGDKAKVEDARGKITSAVIGLLILASVWAIFNLVVTVAFGGEDIQIRNLNEGSSAGTDSDEKDKCAGVTCPDGQMCLPITGACVKVEKV